MEEATDIIWRHLEDDGQMTYAFKNFLRWIGSDELVDWFVNGYFVRDDHDMIVALGKEDAEKVLDYYNRHCCKD